jgi:hypothetical protein
MCWLGGLDDRRMETVGGLAGAGDGDVAEPGPHQQVLVFGLGQRAGRAADLLFGAGTPCRVGVLIGRNIADAEPTHGRFDMDAEVR